MADKTKTKVYIDRSEAATALLLLNIELFNETQHLSGDIAAAMITGAKVMNDKCRAALRCLQTKEAEEIARDYAEAHREKLKKQVGMALIALARCPHCGKIVPDTEFCGTCGKNMETGPEGLK